MPAAALLFQAALEITGLVLGPSGKPLPRATLEAGTARVQTDAKGRFTLRLPPGVTRVRITAPGMEPQEREPQPGEPLYVRMEPKVAEAQVEVVEGSGYGSEGTPQSAITRMEIYTTPGAAADVFQAAKTLPGVSQATEGAELFVRGGKPDEVGIYLNGGHLRHPYHHPTAQGGIFSSVDTAMVTTLNFVPGGFSARYGDALSAVLDLASDGAPVRQGGVSVLTLANQSVQVDQPTGDGLLRASLRHANTGLLDRWFSLASTFAETPVSTDAHLGWHGPVGGGRLSVYGLASRDHLGVETRLGNQVDTYRDRSDTTFAATSYSRALGDGAALQLDVSRTGHGVTWSFGPWGMDQQEQSRFHRLEAVLTPSPKVALELGVDGEQARLSPRGAVPLDAADWTPGRPARTFAYDFDGRRDGLYATARLHLNDALGLSLGGRTDRYTLLDERTRDLRATLSWRASSKVTFRVAGGTFHQAPPMTALDPHMGNPDLKTLRATHAVAAMEARDDQAALPWQVRVEAYRKTYDRLIVEPDAVVGLGPDTTRGRTRGDEERPKETGGPPSFMSAVRRYVGDGHGDAKGLDLLLKARRGRLRGWIGYGWLATERREGRQLASGPAPTSVPHNLTAVGAWTLKGGWELSGTFRMASGAPFTPVLGGRPDGQGGTLPREGARYGARLPAHQRLDGRLTHFFSTGRLRWVAFVEGINLLDRYNVASYSYSPDFTERRAEPSYFSRRILVGGLTLMW